MLPKLPALGKVPNITHDLNLKATSNGVVFLKTSKFRSRYTGNKYSVVDINGNLWLKKTDYQKAVGMPVKGKKKPGEKSPGKVLTGAPDPINAVQISENLLTAGSEISTNLPELSTIPNNSVRRSKNDVKAYTVNGSQVRQRLLGFINTQAGKKELYFWTVTFPQGLTDEAAYKLYNVWLTALRQYKLLKNYLWVAERQENGTVHFHIAIPHKMPVKKANAMMRGTLINAAKRGEIPFSQYLLRKYNGVDIAKNRKTKRVTNFAIKKGAKSLANYLSKYVTKNNGTFKHLAWHNSRGYSGIFTGITFTVNEFLTNHFHHFLHREKKLITEHFIFVPWKNDTGPPAKIMDHLYQLNSYVQSQLN